MHDDDQLLAWLRTVTGQADPVPSHVAEGARAAFAWRTIDHELAELTYDSAQADRQLAGVRSEGGPRMLTFEVPSLTVEVEVVEHGARRRLLGQLVPPASARIEIRQPTGVRTVDVDDLGRFRADDLPSGPTSLRCHLTVDGQEQVVDTDWNVI